jgi:hypothetical protein
MSTVAFIALSNEDLTLALGRLAAGERAATAALVVHLAEFNGRRLHEGAGYPSLFRYCVEVLRLSEDAAYNRIEAARAVRVFPPIGDMLETGALSLTTARLVARHLTPENHRELLADAAGRSREGVEEVLARWFPQADVGARVRKVPMRAATVKAPTTDREPALPSSTIPAGTKGAADLPLPAAAPPAPKPAVVRPLAPARYEIRFTASAEIRDKLRRAQDLLSHAVPTGDIAEVVDRALTLLVAELERKKFAATERPRPPVRPATAERAVPTERAQEVPAVAGRTISSEVRRAVFARDQGRCAFVSPDGHRCASARLIEFHHVVPHARGGEPSAENIALRCRAHNGHEVDLFFGPGVRWTREGRSGSFRNDTRGRGAEPNSSGGSG